MTIPSRTQVVIVGAGPSGLLLGQLLHRAGIETVVLERQTGEYVLGRIRAGVLEQVCIDLLDEAGVGERMHREGLVHRGFELLFGGQRHRIDMHRLTGGRNVMVYGQTELTRDLMDARQAAGLPTVYEAHEVSVHDFDTRQPRVRYVKDGQAHEIACDFIAGCDGFHGVCREAVPEAQARTLQRDYPCAWLGILAEAPPSSEELVYVHHERGFALLSMRTPEISRLYLQCTPDADLEDWPDERIWEELRARIATADGADLNEGPILQKGVT
ncbi:MAG TPA: 4-hydroxybenzoate 3-monooxygenase, partial [Rubrivivax sp.]|nr:4-hydroxybenzoate 3-monooxygenase [Rubrivivax sp.]